jgi:tight adherence protein B
MSPTTVMLATFAAVVLGILAAEFLIFDLFFRHRSRIDQRIEDEFLTDLRQRTKRTPLFRDLQGFAEEAARISWSFRLRTLIAQAGLDLSLGQLAALSLLSAVLPAIGAAVLRGPWFLIALAASLGGVAPLLWIQRTRANRMSRLCLQLPEAFEVMGRALKAGQSVSTAFQVVAQDFSLPIAEEFARCYEQQHLGVPFDEALRDLAHRTGIIETQMFAVALIVNRQVGGNLA